MFNNIIYLITALFIYYTGSEPIFEIPYTYSIFATFTLWVMFVCLCYYWCSYFYIRLKENQITFLPVSLYHRLINILTMIAICWIGICVFAFGIRYWIRKIPGCNRLITLDGSFGIFVFFLCLCAIWYFVYPLYLIVFEHKISRKSFIYSQLRLNIPLIFPWFFISILYDLLSMTHFSHYLDTSWAQILLIIVLLIFMVIFMPCIIQIWWRCDSLEYTEKGREIRKFLKEQKFSCKRILRWPIFEGQMITAAIMGIIPRFRYILLTDSLLEYLSADEIMAIISHEMAHVRYGHIIFYIIFFAIFVAISYGMTDLFLYLSYLYKPLRDFYGLYYISMLLFLIVYFRYIIGFFMRNFERQADLYSVKILGTPAPAVCALRKIAYLSGKSWDLPNWHHFSIKERVECLLNTIFNPNIIKKHNKFIMTCFAVYIIFSLGVVFLLNCKDWEKETKYIILEDLMNKQIEINPHASLDLFISLANIYYKKGRYKKAIQIYKKIIKAQPKNAIALNNLAWLLLTVPDKKLRDEKGALILIKKALKLEIRADFLDTLAEAYFRNGEIEKAIKVIKIAIKMADKDDKPYFKKQLRKFLSHSS